MNSTGVDKPERDTGKGRRDDMTRMIWIVRSHELRPLPLAHGIEMEQREDHNEHEHFRSFDEFVRIVAIRWFLQDHACRVDAMRSEFPTFDCSSISFSSYASSAFE